MRRNEALPHTPSQKLPAVPCVSRCRARRSVADWLPGCREGAPGFSTRKSCLEVSIMLPSEASGS